MCKFSFFIIIISCVNISLGIGQDILDEQFLGDTNSTGSSQKRVFMAEKESYDTMEELRRRFEEIDLTGKRIKVFVDFDGTLARQVAKGKNNERFPILADPDLLRTYRHKAVKAFEMLSPPSKENAEEAFLPMYHKLCGNENFAYPGDIDYFALEYEEIDPATKSTMDWLRQRDIWVGVCSGLSDTTGAKRRFVEDKFGIPEENCIFAKAQCKADPILNSIEAEESQPDMVILIDNSPIVIDEFRNSMLQRFVPANGCEVRTFLSSTLENEIKPEDIVEEYNVFKALKRARKAEYESRKRSLEEPKGEYDREEEDDESLSSSVRQESYGINDSAYDSTGE